MTFQVELYQTHWWRCNGPCQTRRPHFGIVRRSMNQAPGPKDYWWNDHLRKCGGKFIKIKEPQKGQNSKGKKNTTTKTNADITKYITNNIKTMNNIPNNNNKPVLKDSTNANIKTKSNGSSTVVVSKKGVIMAPKPPPKPIPVFTGSGKILLNNITGSRPTDGVTETVRNIWANKQIPTKELVKKDDPRFKKPINSVNRGNYKEPAKVVAPSNPKKHKTESTHLESPPTKIKKIEDYFNASTILKDLYGDDYKLQQSITSTKLVAVNVKVDLVDCPVCSGKFSNKEINRHLDECLNKDIIEKLSKDGITAQESQPSHREQNTKITDKVKLKEIVGVLPPIPAFIPKLEFTPLAESTNNNIVDLTNMNIVSGSKIKNEKPDDIKCPESINNVIDLTNINMNVATCTNIKTEKPDINTPNDRKCPEQLSVPENADDHLVDLTHLDFEDFDDNKDKGKRKSESEATLRRENLVKKVSALVNEMGEAIKVNLNNKRRNTVGLITMDRGDCLSTVVEKDEVEPKAGCSKEEVFGQNCPCCGKTFDKSVEEHLDECLIFFENNTTIPDEGASTSFSKTNNTNIVYSVVSMDDEEDDIFDESQIFNETGTKTPCPCCMKMVEQDDMNSHLDECLLK